MEFNSGFKGLSTVHTAPYLSTVSWVISCTFESRAQLRRRLPWTERSGIWSLAWTRDFVLLSKSSALAVDPNPPPLRCVQSPSEANRYSARQEIARILWNPNVHYRSHSLPPVPFLSQVNPVHASISLTEDPILILFSHLLLDLPNGLFPLRSRHQNPVCTSPLCHKCNLPCPSDYDWFDHPFNIWWGVQIIKLLGI